MKRAALTSFFLTFLLQVIAQDYEGPIIDMHLHDYTKETYYTAPAADGTMSPQSLEEYHDLLTEALKKHKIEKAVVSTIGGPNLWKVDDLFIPGYYLTKPHTDTITFKKLISSGKIKVFGEVGAVYAGLTLSDSVFAPFLSICERYNIPVAVHTGGGPPGIAYRCCPDFRIKLGDPYAMEDVLVKYPNLKIYMMHAGEAFWENAIRMMMQYPQLYADLGVLLWADRSTIDYAESFLRKAKLYGLIDQVMFGSDQMVWPHAIGKSIEQLNAFSFLNMNDKKKIFYDNAVRFLELDN